MAFLLLAGCSGAKPSQSSPPASPATTPTPVVAPTPPPVESPPDPEPEKPVLTDGPFYLLAPPQSPLWAGPVTVVVENSPGSRPQTGLDKADLVVELLAESEITRFLAVYWSTPAETIGPVRSARTTTVALAKAYHAPYAHAGGSTDALAQTQWRDWDIDDIYGGGGTFYRSDSREPPHNLYTNTRLLNEIITGRQLAMAPVPTTQRAASLPSPGQAATRVDIDWHRLHQVGWRWQSDRYLRYEDGEAHLLTSGDQIHAVNLIFLDVKGVNRGPDLGWTLDYQPGGTATVLTAGHRWEGTWSLGDGGIRLTPSGGEVPLLAPGATWVHLITHESSVAIQGTTP